MANNYSRFTITSLPDPSSGGFSIPDYEKDMRAVVSQAVKSALSEGGYFKTANRVVNKLTGETRFDVYVHSEDASVVSDSIKSELNKFYYKDASGLPRDPRYSVTQSSADSREQKMLAREETKGQLESLKFNKGTMLKIVGILTTIADITRRILSSVLTFSTQTAKDMLTAHNLGMSYEAVRAYRHVERTHGLKEGTVTEAVTGEQQKYGNITSLDEKSLEYIALIMGNKVADMATMGLGASNPEAIVSAIVDRANELANSGYNSVGQYVGEQQARRELYSYLLKYSPQIADIFATMQEEQHNINSLYRNQADTFEAWKNLTPTSRGGNGWADYGVVKVTNEQWNKVQDILSQITEGIKVSLADNVLSLLKKIANSRFFMTESERRRFNEENRAKNQAELTAINKTIAQYEGSYDNLSAGEKAYYDVLVEQRDALVKELDKEEIDDITTVPAELEVRAENRLRRAGNTWQAEGTDMSLADVTYDEIIDVARAYNLDTDKSRAGYRKYREGLAKEAEFEVEAINSMERSKLEEEFYNKYNSPKASLEMSKRYNKAVKSGALKRAKKAGVLQADLLSLYSLGEAYNFDYDLGDLVGAELTKKVYAELDRAVVEGYATKDAKGRYHLSSERYVSDRYNPIEHKNGEVDVEYGNDYYKWLYEQNKYKFNPHITDYRTEQEINAMREGMQIATWNWLRETEGTAQDWRKALPSSGTYVIRGENVSNAGGENIYRVVVDVQDNGKTVSSNVAFSVEGGKGYEGVFDGEVINTSSGKVSTRATSASTQASY